MNPCLKVLYCVEGMGGEHDYHTSRFYSCLSGMVGYGAVWHGEVWVAWYAMVGHGIV